VDVADMTEEQLGRVSQLTFRTNQFNFTTIRRTESGIRDFLAEPGAGCLTVRVSDRFGDYGLVGVVLYRTEAERLDVDTLLLSCRVLGRGVEHAVLRALARCALEQGRTSLALAYEPSERNAPAREFLHGLAELATEQGEGSWIFPAERLTDLAYDPDRGTAGEAAEETPTLAQASPATASRSAALQRIAERLRDVESIVLAIAEHRAARAGEPAATPAPPAGSLEATLLGIWRRVLGRPGIGTNDNFFDAGGTSLRAVQVLAAIQTELGLTLSIVSLFEYPTVSRLAARLGAGAGDSAELDARTTRARRRGERRRTARRRTA
jgi:acyl carrier protein